jgi:uncharacterized protein YkwD
MRSQSASISRRFALVRAIAIVSMASGFLLAGPPDDTQIIEPPAERSPDETIPDLAVVTRRIVERTNDFRIKEKRARVAEDPKLMETAHAFAAYMARTDRYGHSADGGNPGDRATRSGYEFSLISENIAYAFSSRGFETEDLATQFVEGWEKSPGHRANMLDPDVTQTGAAVARSEKTGYYFAVQMFGRPKADTIRFEVANRSSWPITYRVGDQSHTVEPRYTMTHEQGRPADVTFELVSEGKTVSRTFHVDKTARFIIDDHDKGVKIDRE